jgi:hypothetical protein
MIVDYGWGVECGPHHNIDKLGIELLVCVQEACHNLAGNASLNDTKQKSSIATLGNESQQTLNKRDSQLTQSKLPFSICMHQTLPGVGMSSCLCRF